VARYIEQASPNAVTSVLFGLAGLNAWLFLLKVPPD
jgi:hypothetical protein